VPQRNQVDERFPVTVRDVVMMGRTGRIGLFRWPGRRDHQLVERTLAQTEMLHLAEQPIGALSGGQQQRVFLARALAQEAHILLLDEPLNGLDAPSQERLIHVLDDLRTQQITILMATHDLNAAAEHADMILLLNRRVIAYGQPRAILAPEVLRNAYGSNLHVFPGHTNGHGESVSILADTCCGGGELLSPVQMSDQSQ
jgi:ABC-type Mn2+/Zn2+ transport system ATPase subunit